MDGLKSFSNFSNRNNHFLDQMISLYLFSKIQAALAVVDRTFSESDSFLVVILVELFPSISLRQVTLGDPFAARQILHPALQRSCIWPHQTYFKQSA